MTLLISPIVALSSVSTLSAFANDSVTKIERSYDANIAFEMVASDRSFYGCRIEKFQITGADPITLEKRAVTIDFYRAKSKNPEAAVIILPPTGGSNILDRGYANELCSSGISAAIVSGWKYQDETSLDFEMHNRGALRAHAATRHVVEFLVANRYQSIGVLGTSIGAVAGSLVLSFEPRISAVTFIVGGADFSEIIATSDESGAKKLRHARMKAFGYYTNADYARAVKNAVWVEPADYLKPMENVKSLVISADADTTVRTEFQLRLVELLQATKHIHRRGNHLQSIKDTFWYNKADIVEFFRQSLAPEEKCQ
jgi:hypothetical protein